MSIIVYQIDLNCDMGEGMSNDELIMPYISSANIACGYHAGDEQTIWKTVELAIKHKANIGAHVSFFDKENFGRSEIKLPPGEVYELITQQLIIMNESTDFFGVALQHVKPHGALYNMSAKDAALAKVIAEAIKDFNKNLLLYGLSGSISISKANEAGVKTINEVFADRSYQDSGSLTPRDKPGALIDDPEIAIKQVLQMVKEQTVTTPTNKIIPIKADSICIHGDGKEAVAFARLINDSLISEGITIKSPS